MNTAAAVGLVVAGVLAVLLDVRRQADVPMSPTARRLLLAAVVAATAVGVVLTALRLRAGG